jgi:hypothetical protein
MWHYTIDVQPRLQEGLPARLSLPELPEGEMPLWHGRGLAPPTPRFNGRIAWNPKQHFSEFMTPAATQKERAAFTGEIADIFESANLTTFSTETAILPVKATNLNGD